MRLYKNNKVYGKDKVHIKDIASLSGPPKLVSCIENICVIQPVEQKKQVLVIDVVKILQLIYAYDQSISVQNVGEMDGIIEFDPNYKKPNRLWEWVKVSLVCLIVFSGATIAIMTYHTDTSLGNTFTILYEVFTGEYHKNPKWITIPYSIGMPIGILVFFNHIGSKKFSEDPTPIQVEIDTYNNAAEDAIIDTEIACQRRQPK